MYAANHIKIYAHGNHALQVELQWLFILLEKPEKSIFSPHGDKYSFGGAHSVPFAAQPSGQGAE